MRVFIGKYPKYWDIYKIVRKFKLSEEKEDKVLEWFEDGYIEKLFNWLNKGKERKIKVRIDEEDVWSMDVTLAHIVLPMLKKVKEEKHGSPIVDDEDLPVEMRYEGENWVHHKWDHVINEMIFAFENTVDDSWEETFSHGNPMYEESEVEIDKYGKCYTVNQINPDYWFDKEGYKAYGDRIQNGFRLFGKYYSSLWT